MFACDIPERDARVELCQIMTDEEAEAAGKKQFTYNYTVGNGPAELYFEDDGFWFSTKYMDAGGDPELKRTTVGVGLRNTPYIYAVFISGEYLGTATGAQVHVYKNEDDFTSDKREIEIERRYCDPATIRVDWSNIAP